MTAAPLAVGPRRHLACVALFLLLLECPTLRAQVPPLVSVGWRNETWTNATVSGSPTMPVILYYPSATVGENSPIQAPPAAGWPSVVWMHGKCANASNYPQLGWALASQGYVVVFEDSAGCDEDLQRDDAIALFPTLAAQVATPGTFLHQAVDMQSVGLGGHSMGGGNIPRVLAQNPGYQAGAGFGAWNGPGPAWWPGEAFNQQVQVPVMYIHGQGDAIEPWATAQSFFQGLSATQGTHVLQVLDQDADHFNIAMPNWVGHGTGIDWVIFARSMFITRGWFDRWLKREPGGLEEVAGPAALADPHHFLVETRVAEPQLWSDVTPTTGQVHCLNILAEPGVGGIFVANASASFPTPIGQLMIDPVSAVPLVVGVAGSSHLQTVCVPLPPNPALIGARFVHQGFGVNASGSLWLSNVYDVTLIN